MVASELEPHPDWSSVIFFSWTNLRARGTRLLAPGLCSCIPVGIFPQSVWCGPCYTPSTYSSIRCLFSSQFLVLRDFIGGELWMSFEPLGLVRSWALMLSFWTLSWCRWSDPPVRLFFGSHCRPFHVWFFPLMKFLWSLFHWSILKRYFTSVFCSVRLQLVFPLVTKIRTDLHVWLFGCLFEDVAFCGMQ